MKISILSIIIALLFLSCARNMYRSTLIPKTKNQVIKNIYGSYVEVYAQDGEPQGEFICLHKDSIYILTQFSIEGIHISTIDSVVFYLAESKKETLAWIGAITLVPPLLGATIHRDYSSEFLVISVPIGILNLGAWLAESSRKSHIMRYPEDFPQILMIQQYARFPFGLPEGIDLNSLGPKSL